MNVHESMTLKCNGNGNERLVWAVMFPLLTIKKQEAASKNELELQ